MDGIDWESYEEQVELTGYDPCNDDEPLDVELSLLETVVANSSTLQAHYEKLPQGATDAVRRRYLWALLDEERPDADEMFDRLVGAGHLDGTTWFRVFTERLGR